MEHQMHLSKQSFEKIWLGKTMELRIVDKEEIFQVGDVVEFFCNENPSVSVKAKITKLCVGKYPTYSMNNQECLGG